MRDSCGRQALATLVGVTAGVASAAVAPAAAHASVNPVANPGGSSDLAAARAEADRQRAGSAGASLAASDLVCHEVGVLLADPFAAYYPAAMGASRHTSDCVLFNGVYDNAAVSKLQNNLNLCYGKGLVVDGDYGPRTADAVAAVQQIHKLPANGVYDVELGSRMDMAFYNIYTGELLKDPNGTPVCFSEREV
jgi:hypothetical protein